MLRNNGFHNRHSPFNRATSPFNPASLFTNGEQGWVYDPSNFATLFQDSTGFTPVTAVEQPVGLQLDLSQNGVGTNGAARYNLLTYSGAMQTTSAWAVGSSVTTTANANIAPDGTLTATAVFPANIYAQLSNTTVTTSSSSTAYTVSCYFKSAGKGFAYIQINSGPATGQETGAVTINLSNGTVGTPFGVGGGTLSNMSATPNNVGNGWYRLNFTFTTRASSTYIEVYPGISDSQNDRPTTVSTTNGVYMWGADLRLASQAALTPTYQPITTSWTATIPGNHRFQATSANRPVVSARVNLLTKTEEFDNASWSKENSTVTPAAIISPDGTLNAQKIVENNSNSPHGVNQSYTQTTGTRYTVSVYAKAAERNYLQLVASTDATALFAFFNLTGDGSVVSSGGGGSPSVSASITNVGNGWYHCIASGTATTTITSIAYIRSSADGITSVYQGNGTSGIYVWGADLRVTNQGVGLPVYQRVNTSTDYTSTGFPIYIKPNGSNQTMATNSINFTATDKMTLWQGVRKLTEPGPGSELFSSSNNILTNNGIILLDAPGATPALYTFASKGTNFSVVSTTNVAFTAPITNVLTGIGDISGDLATLRVNGTQVAQSTTDQGTGNYGNHPVYFYARAGTTFFFGGNDYASIGRGAASTTTQITDAETWVNSKTKAY